MGNYDTDGGSFEEVDLAVGYDVTTVYGVDISVGYVSTSTYMVPCRIEADTEASLYFDYSVAGIDLSAALNKVMDGTMPDYTILVHHMVLIFTAGICWCDIL